MTDDDVSEVGAPAANARKRSRMSNETKDRLRAWFEQHAIELVGVTSGEGLKHVQERLGETVTSYAFESNLRVAGLCRVRRGSNWYFDLRPDEEAGRRLSVPAAAAAATTLAAEAEDAYMKNVVKAASEAAAAAAKDAYMKGVVAAALSKAAVPTVEDDLRRQLAVANERLNTYYEEIQQKYAEYRYVHTLTDDTMRM